MVGNRVGFKERVGHPHQKMPDRPRKNMLVIMKDRKKGLIGDPQFVKKNDVIIQHERIAESGRVNRHIDQKDQKVRVAQQKRQTGLFIDRHRVFSRKFDKFLILLFVQVKNQL